MLENKDIWHCFVRACCFWIECYATLWNFANFSTYFAWTGWSFKFVKCHLKFFFTNFDLVVNFRCHSFEVSVLKYAIYFFHETSFCKGLFSCYTFYLRFWFEIQKKKWFQEERLCHRCFLVNFAKFQRTASLTEHFSASATVLGLPSKDIKFYAKIWIYNIELVHVNWGKG